MSKLRDSTLFYIVIVFYVLLTSNYASASGTFCSGFSVHYVSQRNDFGMQPPEGTKIGETFLSRNGELLGRVEYFVGQPEVGSFDMTVKFEDEVILKSVDHAAAGYKVFSAVLVIEQGFFETHSESVICQTSWAFVP